MYYLANKFDFSRPTTMLRDVQRSVVTANLRVISAKHTLQAQNLFTRGRLSVEMSVFVTGLAITVIGNCDL